MIRERGLKQAWIAGQIGIREPEFSLMVRGKKPLPEGKLSALAKLLRVKVSEIAQVEKDHGHANPPA